MAIGKDKNSPYDEIYLISMLVHHISIVKLTTHDAYVEYLESARLPAPPPAEADWCSPKLQRSHWFDLFDTQQRLEAFRAVWAVAAYLMFRTREEKDGEGDVAMGGGGGGVS
ncbi:hypothetical protein LTR28_011571 [Elasticomyces elasticus]|nr:hypothetical protein LTR28_011571 [Elasticomyces elasticus]